MLTLLALMGCSEYALNSKDDVQAGRDSDVVLGECGFEYTDAAQLDLPHSIAKSRGVCPRALGKLKSA